MLRGPPVRMVSLVSGYDSLIHTPLLFPWIPLCLLTFEVCFQGDRGDPGPEGLAGTAGSTGPEGPVGLTGSPGDRGNNVSVSITNQRDSSCPSSPSLYLGRTRPWWTSRCSWSQGQSGPPGASGGERSSRKPGTTGPEGPQRVHWAPWSARSSGKYFLRKFQVFMGEIELFR